MGKHIVIRTVQVALEAGCPARKEECRLPGTKGETTLYPGCLAQKEKLYPGRWLPGTKGETVPWTLVAWHKRRNCTLDAGCLA